MLTEYMQLLGSKAIKLGGFPLFKRTRTSAEDKVPNPALRRELLLKRQQLKQELGIQLPEAHFSRPVEKPFTRDQRAHTTILFGGLTCKHERLIKAFTDSLGYHFESLPVPSVEAFQTGKEFGNNGQCSPTYFTVGNLVSYLQQLQASGLTRDEIIKNYVFLTAGACGPCRFGMYEAEYRLALHNAGFDGFRVILFQQKQGIFQGATDQGLNLDVVFFLNLLNSLIIGDLLNALAYRIRPYETDAGNTDQLLDQSMTRLEQLIHDFNGDLNSSGRLKSLRAWYELVFGDRFINELRQIAHDFNSIKVDYLQLKPVVKITGEFWAQTTEGDGNYHMFSFLEKENAQVLVEPIGTWITYLLHQAIQKLTDQLEIEKSPLRNFSYYKKIVMLKLGEKVFIRLWNRYCRSLNNIPHALVDQYHLKSLAHNHYNARAQGGEGHLEIGKNIFYSSNDLAHMVLSLKPFGCMPSTQSDGVQSAIVNQYPDMIFLPIETSGESEVNAHSRVQMALGEARAKARAEFGQALERSAYRIEQVSAYIDRSPHLQKAMQDFGHDHEGCAVATVFLQKVIAQMEKDPEYA